MYGEELKTLTTSNAGTTVSVGCRKEELREDTMGRRESWDWKKQEGDRCKCKFQSTEHIPFCDSETSNLGKTERSGEREDVDLQIGAKGRERTGEEEEVGW